jgi:hypothetical protein
MNIFYRNSNQFTTKELQEVASSQISKVQNPKELSSDELQWPEKQSAPKGPKQDAPGKICRDFSQYKLDKIVAGREGR